MLTVKQYNGQYGTKDDVGHIIHISLSVNQNIKNQNKTNNNKQIIILIDISGSMEETFKNVKASLLSFRDSLFGSDLNQNKDIDLRLITFSNEAKEVWSTHSNKSFNSVVANLKTEAMTNMGDALKLAFNKTNPDLFTWIIVMTDGESNEGPCRTSGSFERLVSKKPPNTKIVTLGYGDKFDPEVLNIVGSFVYVEDSEMIPVVLGNLSQEIISAVGFNGDIHVGLDNTIDDDFINIDNRPTRLIVGNEYIGSLCPNVSYDCIYLVGDDKINNINVQYTDIETGELVIVDLNISDLNNIELNEPPGKIKQLYYDHLKNRLTYKLYKAIQNYGKEQVTDLVKLVEKVIDKWIDKESELPKDILLKMLKDIKNNKNNSMSILLNNAINNGYNQPSENILKSTGYYMMSPLLN